MHVAIIGNGIAGITAARFIRKLSDARITVISAESDHFFSRTALMYVYMGHMRYKDIKPYEDWFWEKNRIDLVRGYVSAVDFKQKKLHFDPGFRADSEFSHPKELSYDKLILATGSMPNKFDWPGQELDGVSGMVSLQDLAYINRYSEGLKRAVIVGGGLIGIELAEMFHSRKIPVTFLVREDCYHKSVLPREEAELAALQIRNHQIDLRLNTELKEILPDEAGRVRAVITDLGEEISCGFVGLTAGVHPNIELFENSPIQCAKGILVDDYLQTNAEDVYAIGDCAELRNPMPGRRPIEPLWYVGRIMGETVAYTICGNPKEYRPGIWFNSAKFFDLEYQVYGHVPPELPEGLDTFYYENEQRTASIRINYRKEDQAVVGFNLMGVRYRQEVCEKWIRQEAPIEEVLPQLKLANFDPEFSKTHEEALIRTYNRLHETDIRPKRKRKWAQVREFLSS